MGVFEAYSKYYDLLYRDKDYAAEAEYIHGLVQKFRPGAESILDLGCGTGRHDLLLAAKGYAVTGVDVSSSMLDAAKAVTPPGSRLEFIHGDIRDIRLGRTFDAVIALFHVMSYQTTNGDLKRAFGSAASHIGKGGLFIFDCWYGPAVLTDRPEKRVKKLEDNCTEIIREATPAMHPNENLVDVNYSVMVRDKETGVTEKIIEKHVMRYLFTPEILSLFDENGFELSYCGEWITGREPGFGTWGVCFVASKRPDV